MNNPDCLMPEQSPTKEYSKILHMASMRRIQSACYEDHECYPCGKNTAISVVLLCSGQCKNSSTLSPVLWRPYGAKRKPCYEALSPYPSYSISQTAAFIPKRQTQQKEKRENGRPSSKSVLHGYGLGMGWVWVGYRLRVGWRRACPQAQ